MPLIESMRRGAADRVVDQIGTVPAGDLAQPIADGLGAMVDGVLGSETAAVLGLLRSADDGDHASAERVSDLDRGGPRTARGTEAPPATRRVPSSRA